MLHCKQHEVMFGAGVESRLAIYLEQPIARENTMSISKHSAMHLGLTALFSASVLSFSGVASATAFDSGIPAGWTCTGNCGTLGANGNVTTSPEGGNYGYISTAGTPTLASGGLNIGSETNGTTLRSGLFSANAGDDLEFYFNYITSDGAGYIEYAWARLLDSSSAQVALLFTARTNPSGSTVPGFGLPPITATITPAIVTVTPGATTWSPLAGSSGACYQGPGQGCGNTGWIQSLYEITAAGNYFLELGVVNWADTAYDTGMAFDGILVGGQPIDGTVPEPASLALLGIGLAGLGAMRRRKMA